MQICKAALMNSSRVVRIYFEQSKGVVLTGFTLFLHFALSDSPSKASLLAGIISEIVLCRC